MGRDSELIYNGVPLADMDLVRAPGGIWTFSQKLFAAMDGSFLKKDFMTYCEPTIAGLLPCLIGDADFDDSQQ